MSIADFWLPGGRQALCTAVNATGWPEKQIDLAN
jgi:hypothetical protein